MSNETTLLPCPFCGGEASKRLFYKGKYRVHCNGCDAYSGDVCDTEAEAIAAWNTRAELGNESTGILDVLDLLDEIHYEDRISYDDYSRLFDAIATLGSGTCEMVASGTAC